MRLTDSRLSSTFAIINRSSRTAVVIYLNSMDDTFIATDLYLLLSIRVEKFKEGRLIHAGRARTSNDGRAYFSLARHNSEQVLGN